MPDAPESPPTTREQQPAPAGDARAPWGAHSDHVLTLGRTLRELARTVEPDEIEVRLGLSPSALLDTLLDLRASVYDFTPAFGYPRSAKHRFEHLLETLLRNHPEILDAFHPRLDALLSGAWPLEHTRAAIGSLAEIYDLDYRNTSCLRRVEGQIRLNRDGLRNIAIATLGQGEDLGLVPPGHFVTFAELWIELFAAAAIDWYERAFPTRLDPAAYAGYPTVERVRMLLDDGDFKRYRQYLGRQPPRDMVDTVLASDLERDALLRLADALRQASGKRWKAVGRGIEDGLSAASAS